MRPSVMATPVTGWQDSALRLRCDEIKRFIDPVSGQRFYPVPNQAGDGLVAFPGATSLLSFVAPQRDKDVLEKWRAKEIAAGRTGFEAADRGTRVHSCLERYVRGLDPAPDDLEVAMFYEGMNEPLNEFDSFIWSEAPLRTEDFHTYNTDDLEHPDRLARVWSYALGCSGTPDLVGVRKGRVTMCDYKTSGRPYVQASPKERLSYNDMIGFKQYKKTVRQIIAYAFAVKETLGVEVEDYMIIVGLKNDTQVFQVPVWEIEQETHVVLALAQEFWRKFAQLRADQLQLVAA